MGNVASRLDGIVEQVTMVLQHKTSKEFKERIQDTESWICLCRYPHDNVPKQNQDASAMKKTNYVTMLCASTFLWSTAYFTSKLKEVPYHLTQVQRT